MNPKKMRSRLEELLTGNLKANPCFRFRLQYFGEEGGGDDPPPNDPPKDPPPEAPKDPGLNADEIANQARQDLAKRLGFNSVDEMETALKQKKPDPKPPKDEDAAERIKALEKREAESTARIRELTLNDTLSKAVSALDVQLTGAEDFLSVAKSGLRVEDDGKITVTDAGGNTRYNTEGKPMTVVEYLKDLLEKKPYFVKSSVKGGPGVSPEGGSGSSVETEELKKKIESGSFTMEEFEKWQKLQQKS